MRILVTGANGFIGRQICASLLEAGHEVVAGVRGKKAPLGCELLRCDFNRDTDSIIWQTRLKENNIECVINCVGVLQGGFRQSIRAIHALVPIALFRAAETLKLQYVIQLSALGAGESDTEYAKTKAEADDFVMGLSIPHLVLRPSVVYGSGSYGGTSLFRALSALPIIPMVGKGQQLLAPIYLPELAQAIVGYVENKTGDQIIYPVGSEELCFKDLLIKLRAWLGFKPTYTVMIPKIFVLVAAKFGDYFSRFRMNSTTYQMLEENSIHNPKPFKESIAFRVRGVSEVLQTLPSQTQDRWHARLYFLRPLVRLSLAFLWLFSGMLPFLNPIDSSHYLSLLLTPQYVEPARFGFGILDVLIGIGVLSRFQVFTLGLCQLGMVIAYTLCASMAIEHIWLHPLGPILKNIPIVVFILIWMVLEDDR